MSILADTQIEDLVQRDLLISPFDRSALQGASYDCRLGELFIFGGRPRKIGSGDPGLALEPGSFVLVTTLESLKLPLNLIGRSGITSLWARQGLVCLFSPQIDPGFEGVLEVPLFNGGDAQVHLIPGQRFFTIEFDRMERDASFAWVDRNGADRSEEPAERRSEQRAAGNVIHLPPAADAD